MTDTEDAVMSELWKHVNSLRWQNDSRLAAIKRYREWLPKCKSMRTRYYYRKWLNFLEAETFSDIADAKRRERASMLNIERPGHA